MQKGVVVDLLDEEIRYVGARDENRMSSGAVTIIPQQLPRRHVHPRSDAVAGIARAPVSAAVLARSQLIGKVAALDSGRVGMPRIIMALARSKNRFDHR